jgi:hypothetical protein
VAATECTVYAYYRIEIEHSSACAHGGACISARTYGTAAQLAGEPMLRSEESNALVRGADRGVPQRATQQVVRCRSCTAECRFRSYPRPPFRPASVHGTKPIPANFRFSISPRTSACVSSSHRQKFRPTSFF